MNRIRKFGDIFQVLITPTNRIAPDSPIVVGNWEDEYLRNYHVLEFPTLQEALCVALDYPDIDWYRFVLNHKHIFYRLETTIRAILNDHNFNVEFKSDLMDPGTFKNIMFDRVLNGGERFNLRFGFNDIMSFTIINPWTKNLHRIAKTLELYRAHLYRDDLRIREKRIIDDKIICLYGTTEFGTIYEIKLIPTLIHQWGLWHNDYGLRKRDHAMKLYQKILSKQDSLDKLVIR